MGAMQFPIGTRLLLTYLLLILLALSILGIAVLWPVQNYYLLHLENELIKNSKLVSEIIEPYLLEENYQQVDAIVKDLGKQIETRITIINVDGEILGESDQDVFLMENHADRPEFQSAIKGQIGTNIRFSSTINTDTLYVAVPLVHQGDIQAVIRMALPTLGIEETIGLFRGTLLIGFLLASSVAILLSFKLSKTITRPIEEISKIANKIAKGDLEQKIFNTSTDEIGLLSMAINDMTLALKSHIHEITSSKQRLEAILNHMASGVLVINNKGIIKGLNNEGAKMFGVFEKDVLDRPYQGLIRNYTFQDMVQDVIGKGDTSSSLEFSLLHPVKLTIKAYVSPVVYNDKTEQVVIVFHDITSLRQLEKIKTEFVANASHELRTPVAAIKGFSETLLDGALEDKEASRRFVEIIDKEAHRLTGLINDLLYLSRLEVKNNIDKGPVNVEEVLMDCVTNLANYSADQGVQIIIDKKDHIPEILANKELLTSSFINLIDNGIKYTPRGGFLRINVEKKCDMIKINFTDNGIGIPKDDLPRIFERFYRVDKSRNQDIKGTGLGLSIVKYIMEQHQGYIHVQSEIGKGSTFILTLPIK